MLGAGGDIRVEAAEERHSERHEKKEKQSGVFGSGGAGFTIGRRSLSQTGTDEAVTAAPSTVGSIEGDVTVSAGGAYRQTGSDVIAPAGDIRIEAARIDIEEARETRTVTQTVKSKQSGLTVSVSSPVITAVQTAQSMSQAARDTKDSRMQALAAANVALAGYNAFSAVSANPGQAGGVSLNLSLGTSKSKSSSVQTSDTAAGSVLHAGRDLTLTATPSPLAGEGGGEGTSDITVQGSDLTAGRHLSLTAENDIRLLAARNETTFSSQSKSSSASIGVGFMLGGTQTGFTIQAGVSSGRGKADGQDVSHSNTHATAGDTLTLQSGGDATLKGAVAKGDKVVADIGGNLAIESLQDSSTYDSKQKSAGGSISLCLPPLCAGASPVSGSVSASNSKVKSDYASVTEQSAIRAGDGGFDVAVAGDTALTGGAITSTQQAVDEQRNRFETGGQLTTSDIENKAEYKAGSTSVSIGTSVGFDGKLAPGGTSAGFGKEGDKAESMTLAAISGVAGNTAARTGDAETGLAPIFDANRVQREIEAQTRITQMFGQLAPEAWGRHANAKFAEALNAGDEEGVRCWGPDGLCRAGGHAVLGGLAGGVGGAAGAGLSSVAAPHVQAYLIDQGIAPAAASAVTQLAAIGAGSAVGGTTGAAGAFNEASNNAIVAVPFLVEGIVAGGVVAARACLSSPACLNALRLGGTALVAKVASMLSQEELAQIPGFEPEIPPSASGPMVTPIPDPAQMQNLYGPPPLQDPEKLRAWLANALEGYPADEAERWARDLIRTLPMAEQQRYGDFIILQVWSSTKSKTAPENALSHWEKHMSEFPEYQNSLQYVQAARNFANNPPPGTLTKTRPNGDTLYYDPSTNVFVSQSKDGMPKTMFKPTAGIDYWDNQ